MVHYITKPKSMYDNPDEKLSTHACRVPFKHIEIHSHGQVSACCYTWLPVWVGNLLNETPQQIIDSAHRKRIQDNMRQGKFDDCNDQCPQLNAFLNNRDKSHHYSIIPIKQLDEKLKYESMFVYFSYDLSCNLQCPSCRKNLIVWHPDDPNDEDGQRIKIIHERVKELVNILVTQHDKVVLSITGSGDPFASPLYWEYLVELAQGPIPDNLFIILQTNGVMMTEKNWELIKPLWSHINYINVSVDAATEETYKIVRKNGNFKKLKKNLEVLDQMIVDGCFPSMDNWQTNIVVQRDNFKELKQFVDWQMTYKSKPKIWTNLIAQWYHMNDSEFNDMAIWQDGHVSKQELVDILKDPVFRDPQIKLGNLSSFLPQ